MTLMKEIGELLITYGERDYFFRPSFANMTRIGEPEEIVSAFYDLHHDEVSGLMQRAMAAYGCIPEWIVQHIKSSTYGRKALSAAVSVLDACCDDEICELTGDVRPARTRGRTFKIRRGAMDEFDMVVLAQSLIVHGIIGKAKVRKLQRHEGGEATKEFNAFDYINAARNHFGMSRTEAELLTMTEFQMLLAAKYPEQKGFTREEYDAVADDYMAKKARRLKMA
ncbi:DUF6246 family protein [Pectobacterium zantedeschiae]|uniref:Uncharacterized protein n=1 Tax=Pectobacterium zantedeschiae TaxID=2034769 RepID=A0A9X8JJI1_9GAMM|nr:DUF6246 family protein [Pectobacterium zantedeschiae]RYC44602.1 hypothetical protein CLR69_06175 [Pectobacterium zantedeschiae]RYC49760.1 hypothetical protein CTN06_01975 [Pectobacterium zantedeschiae]